MTERYRLQYNFWLNHNNADDVAVADTVELLKNQRAFTQVVKDGIMLVNELRQGKTDLLLKLFPWIADRLSAPANGGGGDLERQIEELKRIVMQQGTIAAPPPDYPVMKPAARLLPKPQVQTATVDAGAIADDFLAFIQ